MSDDDLLKEEYLAVQKTIGDYDGKMLVIKAWSVTLSAAGLSLAYVQHQPLILLIASVSATVFWYIEALWKILQRAIYPRVEQIEAHFSPEGPKTTPFKVSRTRRAEFARRSVSRRAFEVFFWPHVMLPHAAIALAGLLLFVIARP